MDTYENLMILVNGTEAGAPMRRLDDDIHIQNRKKAANPATCS